MCPKGGKSGECLAETLSDLGVQIDIAFGNVIPVTRSLKWIA
jgi:hypothetical protein